MGNPHLGPAVNPAEPFESDSPRVESEVQCPRTSRRACCGAWPWSAGTGGPDGGAAEATLRLEGVMLFMQ